ncbi:Scar-like domain-containing protein WAVE 5 [Zea mays]|uniref:Scar-like domain-containing protein WAVE 5 n=1 Tax=Zea mays TaxID=4577 RepID=B6TIQ1_MAIZE|nr:hypothetical protein [Zea mays]ONM04438.1 Scar-like domain-containing protein WAVE 5 [Zea mays]|eukprot:XP_008665148.1 uncharacterized protein LOC100216782 isoform X1 [Zea mays]
MPLVRFEVRNEVGLGDPGLYGGGASAAAGEEEEPNALLEGVAVAGLVGILRQLGDLAERGRFISKQEATMESGFPLYLMESGFGASLFSCDFGIPAPFPFMEGMRCCWSAHWNGTDIDRTFRFISKELRLTDLWISLDALTKVN